MKIIVGGLLEKEGKYLLVQEAKEICREKWNIPAGHLELNETIIEGAKREIFEECGCKVNLTGIINIANKVIQDKTIIFITFATDIIEENIEYNKNEILDAKWFTYEEIINMKENLRDCAWIIDLITAHKNNKIYSIDIIKDLS